MATLLTRLLRDTTDTFACAAFGDTRKIQAAHAERIDSFVIPSNRGSKSMDKALGLCCHLVDEWKPDFIHIHGTEGPYGLLTARSMVACPTVISFQGLLGPCSEWYRYFGNTSLMNIIRMHRWLEIPAMRGQWLMFYRLRKAAKREQEIIKGNQFFIGRTAWDRAYVKALNPSAHYYHGGEMLRDAFWNTRWDLGLAQRHRIIFTNAGHPRKGAEILLDAVTLLQQRFPNVQVAIAGCISQRSGYGRYIRRRILELDCFAKELGQLNAKEMADELCRSHVFVSPSYIDNSPNAVCEAQLLGMPVISTYTGGVPSLIEDGQTGLFFPTGDVPMLAAKLREVFEDDELAKHLGSQARTVALSRHDPELVIRDVLTAYEDILRRTS